MARLTQVVCLLFKHLKQKTHHHTPLDFAAFFQSYVIAYEYSTLRSPRGHRPYNYHFLQPSSYSSLYHGHIMNISLEGGTALDADLIKTFHSSGCCQTYWSLLFLHLISFISIKCTCNSINISLLIIFSLVWSNLIK